MKEVEKKDVPEVSGGKPVETGWLPIMPYPLPGYPRAPGLPVDPLDPLGDGKHHVQS
jgi:hypothetical protein